MQCAGLRRGAQPRVRATCRRSRSCGFGPSRTITPPAKRVLVCLKDTGGPGSSPGPREAPHQCMQVEGRGLAQSGQDQRLPGACLLLQAGSGAFAAPDALKRFREVAWPHCPFPGRTSPPGGQRVTFPGHPSREWTPAQAPGPRSALCVARGRVCLPRWETILDFTLLTLTVGPTAGPIRLVPRRFADGEATPSRLRSLRVEQADSPVL